MNSIRNVAGILGLLLFVSSCGRSDGVAKVRFEAVSNSNRVDRNAKTADANSGSMGLVPNYCYFIHVQSDEFYLKKDDHPNSCGVEGPLGIGLFVGRSGGLDNLKTGSKPGNIQVFTPIAYGESLSLEIKTSGAERTFDIIGFDPTKFGVVSDKPCTGAMILSFAPNGSSGNDVKAIYKFNGVDYPEPSGSGKDGFHYMARGSKILNTSGETVIPMVTKDSSPGVFPGYGGGCGNDGPSKFFPNISGDGGSNASLKFLRTGMSQPFLIYNCDTNENGIRLDFSCKNSSCDSTGVPSPVSATCLADSDGSGNRSAFITSIGGVKSLDDNSTEDCVLSGPGGGSYTSRCWNVKLTPISASGQLSSTDFIVEKNPRYQQVQVYSPGSDPLTTPQSFSSGTFNSAVTSPSPAWETLYDIRLESIFNDRVTISANGAASSQNRNGLIGFDLWNEMAQDSSQFSLAIKPGSHKVQSSTGLGAEWHAWMGSVIWSNLVNVFDFCVDCTTNVLSLNSMGASAIQSTALSATLPGTMTEVSSDAGILAYGASNSSLTSTWLQIAAGTNATDQLTLSAPNGTGLSHYVVVDAPNGALYVAMLSDTGLTIFRCKNRSTGLNGCDTTTNQGFYHTQLKYGATPAALTATELASAKLAFVRQAPCAPGVTCAEGPDLLHVMVPVASGMKIARFSIKMSLIPASSWKSWIDAEATTGWIVGEDTPGDTRWGTQMYYPPLPTGAGGNLIDFLRPLHPGLYEMVGQNHDMLMGVRHGSDLHVYRSFNSGNTWYRVHQFSGLSTAATAQPVVTRYKNSDSISYSGSYMMMMPKGVGTSVEGVLLKPIDVGW